MNISRRQLRRIIREAHGGARGAFPERYDTGIPIDDLEWQPDEKGHMNVSNAGGGDWWSTLDSEDDLPVWKEQVASHGAGSTVVFSMNRWMPHTGPWADAARKYRQAKFASLSKPLFELQKISRRQLRRIIREELAVISEISDVSDGDETESDDDSNLYLDLTKTIRAAKDTGVGLDGTVHAIGEVLTDQMYVGYSTEDVLTAFGKWIKWKEQEQLKSYRGAGR